MNEKIFQCKYKFKCICKYKCIRTCICISICICMYSNGKKRPTYQTPLRTPKALYELGKGSSVKTPLCSPRLSHPDSNASMKWSWFSTLWAAWRCQPRRWSAPLRLSAGRPMCSQIFSMSVKKCERSRRCS